MIARAADPYLDTDVIDSRAPRFNQAVVGVVSALAVTTGWWWLLALLAAAANMVGIAVLGAASVESAAGWATVGTALGLLVAALALVAAVTGFCTGCEVYKLGRRLSGRPFVSCPMPPRPA